LEGISRSWNVGIEVEAAATSGCERKHCRQMDGTHGAPIDHSPQSGRAGAFSCGTWRLAILAMKTS
jgi:hypothetical protein